MMENKKTWKIIVGAVLLMMIGLIIIAFFGFLFLFTVGMGGFFIHNLLCFVPMMLGIFMCYYSMKISIKNKNIRNAGLVLFMLVIGIIFSIGLSLI